ncbi:hypothetical protein LEP1GSC195_1026 [Leptospira wolbachii serovar Codice str. CDC]|uniref:Uncharacterized protein n=1 Tax=Leptospira wolbachii serovar Codice str. CDC TaxID=1218599 RepID=R9A729_9LEPT|nr:hypothetical protein LEP1GSC195_1026 [Leptospira wolbachii serovar Codice str. CDC]
MTKDGLADESPDGQGVNQKFRFSSFCLAVRSEEGSGSNFFRGLPLVLTT